MVCNLPTHVDLQYGEHKNTVMDVWLAESTQPTPVDVAIHGGGFTGGDKSKYQGCEDTLAWMSTDGPPIWMKNNMRGSPTDPLDKGHVNHHPAHVERLKKRADEFGMDTVAIAPTVGIAIVGRCVNRSGCFSAAQHCPRDRR